MQEWLNLYQAAIEFKKIECWEWMEDSDLFGVRNPETGEIGYCCVLGALGKVFGLVVYLGTDGLQNYLKVQSGEISPDDLDTIHFQDCLMASFDDRRSLKKQDLQVIKSLNLNFRGPNAWPLFRRYEPGYEPWFVNRPEAIFLTLALEQAKEIALRFMTNRGLLDPPAQGHYLIREMNREKEGWIWRDAWIKPALPKKKEAEIPVVDEIRLQRIKKMVTQTEDILEMDFSHSPFLITGETEKPYYPYLLLCVQSRSGIVLKHSVANLKDYLAAFQGEILNFMEEVRSLPREIRVKKKDSFRLLEPIASKLGIKLTLTKNLPALEKVKEAMQHIFLSGKFR